MALVTGASRGIGRAIAVRLAGAGAVVVAAARGDNAGETAAVIQKSGGQAEAVSLDVTDAASIKASVAGAVERHGRVDILVNNAGITRDTLLLRMKREDWDAVLQTNLTAAFALCAGRAEADDQAAGRPHREHHVGRRPGGATRGRRTTRRRRPG